MQKEISIGILGCGTVGTGVVQLLQQKREEFFHKVGVYVNIKKILVKDPEKNRPDFIPKNLFTNSINDIVNDSEIKIVVELIGGTEPACSFILDSIKKGKHIVTANKEVIAKLGKKIFSTASDYGVSVYIEGSVGGGIPVIQTFKRNLVSNKILSFMGIINGTTNYILTEMSTKNREFNEVLKEAQNLGYAESDPVSDIEGYDAVYKLAILSSIIFGHRIEIDEIYREGISKISSKDILYTKAFGYVIKLLAIAKHEDNILQARVHPTLIPVSHPLASVNGVYNALLIKGDAVGDVMLYGQGAGMMPTASVVVSDILNIISEIDNPTPNRLMSCQHKDSCKLTSVNESVNSCYLRIHTLDQPGVLGTIGKIFGDSGISINSLLQRKETKEDAEIVFITHPVKWESIKKAVNMLQNFSTIKEICSVIRIEDI